MIKLKINPLVVEDLKSIRDYIAEDNEQSSKKVLEEIYKRFEILQKFPSMGADLAKRVSFKTNYKYVIYTNYIIIYRAYEDAVEIYRVINRYQDMTAILFK